MTKSLAKLVALGSIALASVNGCIDEPIYYTSNPVYTSPAPQRQQYQIIDNCTNPKILTRNTDPRFANFTEYHFMVKAMDSNGNPRGELRWVYGPGERFVIAANYENQPVMNSISNFVFQDPRDRIVSWENKRITVNDAFHIKGFSTNEVIQKVGPGIYTATFGIDGKTLCILKIKVDN